MAGRIEARGEFEAALQQCLCIRIPPQARGDLGQHAQSRNIGRMPDKMRAQSRLGLRQIVRDQRRGRFHQARILGRGPEIARSRLVRAARIAVQVEVIGEQAPGIGGVRFELQCAAQRGDRLGHASGLCAGDGKLQVRGGRSRLLSGERLEHLERELGVSGDAMSCAENQPGMRMSGDGLQDLVRLFYRETGVLLQQSCSMP